MKSDVNKFYMIKLGFKVVILWDGIWTYTQEPVSNNVISAG